MDAPRLEVDGLERREAAQHAASRFRWRRGEMVAVRGANDSDKSTLLKTLYGLVRPTRGTVRYRVNGAFTPRQMRPAPNSSLAFHGVYTAGITGFAILAALTALFLIFGLPRFYGGSLHRQPLEVLMGPDFSLALALPTTCSLGLFLWLRALEIRLALLAWRWNERAIP